MAGVVAEVVVRPTTLDDVDAVLAMYAAVAAEGRWIGREVPFDLGAARERIAAAVDADGHHSTVAELVEPGDPGEPAAGGGDPRFGALVGQLHLGVEAYGVAELGMHVAAGHRGQGIGSALLDEAIGWATAQPGVHKVALQVWPHNEAALALYRRSGFEQEGRLREHYRRTNGELWDAVVMGRRV